MGVDCHTAIASPSRPSRLIRVKEYFETAERRLKLPTSRRLCGAEICTL
jgi:hypothetical protein